MNAEKILAERPISPIGPPDRRGKERRTGDGFVATVAGTSDARSRQRCNNAGFRITAS